MGIQKKWLFGLVRKNKCRIGAEGKQTMPMLLEELIEAITDNACKKVLLAGKQTIKGENILQAIQEEHERHIIKMVEEMSNKLTSVINTTKEDYKRYYESK